MKANALNLNIYKHKGKDWSNNGISSRYDEILLLCEDGYIEVDLDNPPENLCKLVRRNLWGTDYYHVEPYAKPEHLGWMYGGCIVDTSDSRFAAMKDNSCPLHLHDRQETQEMYDRLSR